MPRARLEVNKLFGTYIASPFFHWEKGRGGGHNAQPLEKNVYAGTF
jgi:hypothetical protein